MITPADAALMSCVLWACRAAQLWETRSRVGRGPLIIAGAFGRGGVQPPPTGLGRVGRELRDMEGEVRSVFSHQPNKNGFLKVPFQMESFLLSDPSVVVDGTEALMRAWGGGLFLFSQMGARPCHGPLAVHELHTLALEGMRKSLSGIRLYPAAALSGPRDLCNIGKNGMNFNAGGHN